MGDIRKGQIRAVFGGKILKIKIKFFNPMLVGEGGSYFLGSKHFTLAQKILLLHIKPIS